MSAKIDPYDLRPFTKAILQKIEDELTDLPSGTPLFVVVGENHNKPAHRVLLKHLIANLFDRQLENPTQRVSIGFEYARDFIGQLLHTANSPLSPEDLDKLIASDPDGQKALKLMIANQSDMTAAAISERSLKLFLYFNEISFSCNDIRRGMFFTPKTLENPDIIYERNRTLAENAMLHAERSKAKIYIQHCGQMHVFGKSNQHDPGADIYPYEQSIASILQTAGASVLPVLLDDDPRSIAAIPQPAQSQADNAFFIQGLANDYVFNPLQPPYETDVLKKIVTASGGDVLLWKGTEQKKLLKKEIKQQIPHWLNQIRSIDPT